MNGEKVKVSCENNDGKVILRELTKRNVTRPELETTLHRAGWQPRTVEILMKGMLPPQIMCGPELLIIHDGGGH